jgi:hypothetical protein
MKGNKVFGSILIVVALLGYLTIADDLRHVGEFLGVTTILISGIILLGGGFFKGRVPLIMSRILSIGLLSGIPLGGWLDSMILGPLMGFGVGIVFSIALACKNRQDDQKAP